MRKPSRLMPKYSPPQDSDGWKIYPILLFLFICLAILAWQVPWILLFVVIYLISAYISEKRWEKKFSKMVRERNECDIGTFARSFDVRSVDTWVIRAVYEQIQGYVSSSKQKLPILAEDKLFTDLEIDDEDFELGIMEEIAQRTRRTFDDCEKNPFYEKVNTVSDLVHYFNKQPIKNNQ